MTASSALFYPHRMKNLSIAALIWGTSVTLLAAAPPASPQEKPTIAIVDFDQAPGGWVLPPPNLGSTVAQLMLDRLVHTNSFRVLDGQWLQYGTRQAGDRRIEVLRENAREAGVDYLVLGSITSFGNEHKNRTIGGAGFLVPILGGVKRKKDELAITILVRVIDARTGEVMTTATGSGIGRRKNVGVGLLGLVGVPLGGLASIGSSHARDAQLAEAIGAAVGAAAERLIRAAPRLQSGPTKDQEPGTKDQDVVCDP
jgi:curli biogenesis system outer membrane secretion channel CsgG